MGVGKGQEAFSYLFQSIQKCEECRDFLKDNDDFRVLYSDAHKSPYISLRTWLHAVGIIIQLFMLKSSDELGPYQT